MTSVIHIGNREIHNKGVEMETQEIRHIALPTGEYNNMFKINCRSLKQRLWNLQEKFPQQTWAIAPVVCGTREYLHIVEIVEVGA